jgi:hypothetical protein
MTATADVGWQTDLAELRDWAEHRRIVDAHLLVQALDEIERLGRIIADKETT